MYPENKKRKDKVSMATDLAIFNDERKIVEVAIEFKYEPSHQRKYNPKSKETMPPDIEPAAIWHGKYPVTSFRKQRDGKNGSVEEDIERIIQYVTDLKARYAYAIFIDEGQYYRKSDDEPFPGSKWSDWELSIGLFPRVSVLWSHVAFDSAENLLSFW